jgi:iron-sulfur cluster assembly protein
LFAQLQKEALKMMTITPQASEAIRGILESESVPDGAVLRISSQPDAGLAVSVTGSPPPDDQVIQGEEVEICVEPTAAEALDDKELDANVSDGEVSFTIGAQG